MPQRFAPVAPPLLLGGLLTLLGASSPAKMPQQMVVRVANPVFAASVTSFHTSLGANGAHYADATIHFQNLTTKPLILGSDRSKIAASDDKGNRYVVTAIRGIGSVAGKSVDPRFVLPPGGGGDALVELRWNAVRGVEFGLAFDLNLAAREVETFPSGQLRLGAERVLEFTGLKTGLAQRNEGAVDAGAFTAQVTRTKVGATPNRRLQTVDLTVRFKNTSDKPLILAYEATSSYGVDDQGNRYAYGRPGTHDTSVSGIGMTSAASDDPQFALAPGEEREAHFVVVRDLSRDPAGTEMVYYVALQGLEILPSKQIREIRQYSLTFLGLSLRN